MLRKLVKEEKKNFREEIEKENAQHGGEAGLIYDKRRKIQIIQGNKLESQG